MKKIQFKILLLFSSLLIFGVAGKIQAAEIVASSCQQADVQAAINSSADGDTIFIPACSLISWDVGIAVSKNIKIKGAGYWNGLNYVDMTSILLSATGPRVIFDFSGTGSPEISGITFTVPQGASNSAALGFHWHLNFFKAYDNHFTNCRGRAIIAGNDRGVIFSNKFDTNLGVGQFILLQTDYDNAFARWTKPTIDWESDNAIYIEGNYFSTPRVDGLLDCAYGGRAVVRYNNALGDINFGGHGFDSDPVGCLFLIAYKNHLDCTGGIYPFGIQYRGGTGLVFNNDVVGYNCPATSITTYRACSASPSGWCGSANYAYCTTQNSNGWKICTSDSDCVGLGVCNRKTCSEHADIMCIASSDCALAGYPTETCTRYLDGSGPNGYPCRHQSGRGVNGQLQPIYVWGNTNNGILDNSVNVYNGAGGTCYTSSIIQSGRDYYNDGKSYPYSPYSCPHPLTDLAGSCDTNISGNAGYNVSASDTIPPFAPQGLSVK